MSLNIRCDHCGTEFPVPADYTAMQGIQKVFLGLPPVQFPMISNQEDTFDLCNFCQTELKEWIMRRGKYDEHPTQDKHPTGSLASGGTLRGAGAALHTGVRNEGASGVIKSVPGGKDSQEDIT